jgi:hypothetical protein
MHRTEITTDEYAKVISADAALNFYYCVKVKETGQTFIRDDLTLKVEKPELEVKVSTGFLERIYLLL